MVIRSMKKFAIAILIFAFGSLVGFAIGRHDRPAATKATLQWQAQRQELIRQMDSYCSGRTVYLATANAPTSAAVEPFLIHGAKYGGKDADFAFSFKHQSLGGRLVIRNKRDEVIYTNHVSMGDPLVAGSLSQRFLATLAHGDSVAAHLN